MALLGLMACGRGAPVDSASSPAARCADAEELPVAPEATGAGDLYEGSACLTVSADVLGQRRDACAGTLSLRVDDDLLTGTGACRYIGLPGELGLAELLPGPQQASLMGRRTGRRWAGELTVITSLGSFNWDWSGAWDGPDSDITGEIEGQTSAEMGEQTVRVSGSGSFEAWPMP